MYSSSNLSPFTGNPIGPTVTCMTGIALLHTSHSSLMTHSFNTTNLYARLNPFGRFNYQWQDTSVEELRTFLGIFIATGLVFLPNLQDYWETDSIYSQPGIVKEMSRNRFQQLCGRLHFYDNSLAPVHGTQRCD